MSGDSGQANDSPTGARWPPETCWTVHFVPAELPVTMTRCKIQSESIIIHEPGEGGLLVAEKDVAERLAILEKEVAELKRHLEVTSGDWPDCLFGRMKDFPEFDEVAEMGRELRESQTDPGQ